MLEVLAVAAGLAAAFFGWRALFPNRRVLRIKVLPPAPLLSEASKGVDSLKVSLDGQELASPHLLTMEIRDSGTFDITKDQFHDGESVYLNVGTRIVCVLESSDAVKLTASGELLEYHPQLIKKRVPQTVHLLVDGPPAIPIDPAAFVSESLVDVRITVDAEAVWEATEPAKQKKRRRRRLNYLAIAASAGALVLVYAWLNVNVLPNFSLAYLDADGNPVEVAAADSTMNVLKGQTLQFAGERLGGGEYVEIWLCPGDYSKECRVKLDRARKSPSGDISGRVTIPASSAPGSFEVCGGPDLDSISAGGIALVRTSECARIQIVPWVP